jgi:HlyD family secretion protein
MEPSMSDRRRACAALGAVLLAATLGPACGDDAAVPKGPTARAERGSIERLVVATGTIEPEREVEVRPRIPGIVQRIHVAAGDVVEAKAPLVEIERELLEAQVREARAARETAGVEERYAKIALDRAEKLRAKGAASDRALDDARSRFETARAAVAQRRAALESLEVQLSYTHIVAPAPGRVLDVYVEEGDAVAGVAAVTGGTLLLSLASTSSQHLEGLVDENEVARVAVGQPARIRTEAHPGRTFAGRVREIAPVGKREQNVTYFEVEVEVVDPDAELLKPRMSADADIVAEVVADALIVPATALRYEGERTYVETIVRESEPRIAPVDVQVGIVDGGRVQLLGGIEEGTEVLLK